MDPYIVILLMLGIAGVMEWRIYNLKNRIELIATAANLNAEASIAFIKRIVEKLEEMAEKEKTEEY